MKKILLSMGIMGLHLLVSFSASAITISETDKLLGDTEKMGDGCGTSVSINGDIAIVGCPYDDDEGLDSGAVYVYLRDSSTKLWSQVEKLHGSDAMAGDYFGYHVSVSGSTIVVGAIRKDVFGFASVGGAYIFETSDGGLTWSETEILTPSDGRAGDYFGFSVSVSGDVIAIGSPQDDIGTRTNTGSVYIYTYSDSGWSFADKLTASDSVSSDYFGVSLAVDSGLIAIGAYGHDEAGASSCGAVYIFDTVDGLDWTQSAQILASDFDGGDTFGWDVALSKEVLVVSAVYDEPFGANSGSVYIFTEGSSSSDWTESSKLTASDGAAGDVFGNRVDLDGDVMIVGAEGDDDLGSLAGATYVFTNTGSEWEELTKITASDGDGDDYFGFSVSIDGDTFFIGASRDDEEGVNSGAAYVYDITGSTGTIYYKDCDGDGYGTIETGTIDCGDGTSVSATEIFSSESEANDAGYVDNSKDCHDDNSYAHPGAEEIMEDDTVPGVDEYDDNCDGILDDGTGRPPFVSSRPVHFFGGDIDSIKLK